MYDARGPARHGGIECGGDPATVRQPDTTRAGAECRSRSPRRSCEPRCREDRRAVETSKVCLLRPPPLPCRSYHLSVSRLCLCLCLCLCHTASPPLRVQRLSPSHDSVSLPRCHSATTPLWCSLLHLGFAFSFYESSLRLRLAARSRLGEHSEVWHSAHFHRWLLAAPHSSPAYQSRHCRPHPAPRRWLAVRAVVGAASRASGARCTTASAAVADVSCKKSKKRFVMCLFTFNNLSQYNDVMNEDVS